MPERQTEKHLNRASNRQQCREKQTEQDSNNLTVQIKKHFLLCLNHLSLYWHLKSNLNIMQKEAFAMPFTESKHTFNLISLCEVGLGNMALK